MKKFKRAGKRGSSRGTYQPLSVSSAVGVARSPFLRREVRVKLMYHDTYQLATSSGIAGIQLFRANSLFDPDFTNVGHQPMFRDQIAAMYQNYRVLKAKFTWQAQTSNTNTGLISVSAYSSTPPTVLNEGVEFSRRPPQMLSQYQHCRGSVTIDIATVLGLESRDYATNSLYNTALGSNASPVAYFQVALDRATLTDTGASVDVTIEFDAIVSLPLDPGLS